MEKETKLSIVIPMYNAERYISNIFSYFLNIWNMHLNWCSLMISQLIVQ